MIIVSSSLSNLKAPFSKCFPSSLTWACCRLSVIHWGRARKNEGLLDYRRTPFRVDGRPCRGNKCALLNSGRVRLGSIRNKNNWNHASKRLFGSYSHSGITGFPFRLFCPQEQNSRNIFRNIFLFRNIPNERALNARLVDRAFNQMSLSYLTCDQTSFFSRRVPSRRQKERTPDRKWCLTNRRLFNMSAATLDSVQ